MSDVKKVAGWANIYKEKGSVMDYSIFLYERFETAEVQAFSGTEIRNAPKRWVNPAIWLELEVGEK